jgi:hypothetical protein
MRIFMLNRINTSTFLDDTVQLIAYKDHSLCLASTPKDENEGDEHEDWHPMGIEPNGWTFFPPVLVASTVV